jgi:mRNA interferase RelE/StbE
MRVLIAEQVRDFVARQAPEPRRLLRQALRGLAKNRGDVKHLEGPLDGYCRLRVHGYRIIFAYADGEVIECVFAERRGIVYEIFGQLMVDRLGSKSG